jgi:chromosome segregation ATPase
MDVESADVRAKLERLNATHQAERTRLEERHAAAEAHWLTEVDRARQQAKDQDRQIKELQGQIGDLRRQHDPLRQELLSARADLKTASAVREQLEARLREAARVPGEAMKATKAKQKAQGKSKRTPRRSNSIDDRWGAYVPWSARMAQALKGL